MYVPNWALESWIQLVQTPCSFSLNLLHIILILTHEKIELCLFEKGRGLRNLIFAHLAPFSSAHRLLTWLSKKTNSKKETTLLQTFSVHFSEVKLCRLCLFVVYLCPNCGRSGLVVIMSYFLAKEKVFEKLWIAWWKRFSIVVAIDKNLRFLVTWISRCFSRLFSTSLGTHMNMIKSSPT